MYSDLKSYQIIIALLKKWNIRHCVLSAGSRNVPFVHSVEEDPFFKCYSVVDERSAGYFALGLSQQIQEPVVISCTASTASCNYWPPVAEAFYQGVPLVILTSDRDAAMLGQWEDQMIDQVGMFDRHVRKSVNLPEVKDERDWIFCQRLVNEALLELNHHGTGPVHINIPMESYSLSFKIKELPEVTKIDRLDVFSDKSEWDDKLKRLQSCKRILVTCGQMSYVKSSLNDSLGDFFNTYDASIAVEHMGNVSCDGCINTSVCFETKYVTNEKFEELMPEIVISYGNNITQGLKQMLRKNHGKFEHWLIQEDGRVIDMYKSLTTIFECPIDYFFKRCNEFAQGSKNSMEYHSLIKDYADSVEYPDFPYCSVYAIQEIVSDIPSGSILQLAINNSIRITNFFKLNPNVTTYANIGTYGIDGCLSTLIGQASATKGLAFLITGDLAFFYDMNALRIKHVGRNIRVLMVNNEGGGEFYYNGTWRNESSDLHTTARHHTKAEGWVKECGFQYIGVHNMQELLEAKKVFFDSSSNLPVFMEVFTEMKDDAQRTIEFYNYSKPSVQLGMKGHLKNFIKSTLGDDTLKSIKRAVKK